MTRSAGPSLSRILSIRMGEIARYSISYKSFLRGSSESDKKGSDESNANLSQHSMNMLDNYIDHYGEFNYAYIIDNE